MDTHTSYLGEAGIIHYEDFDQFPEKNTQFHRLET
ncbi:hypothetical protein LCGC14_1362270 [marine sediment metagenome]|uniref:Uncharacterized protein n=1 Tax=marine sediment metagenome TaxID=412755 RepID=A0A0F9K8C2_9ZZZZ